MDRRTQTPVEAQRLLDTGIPFHAYEVLERLGERAR
jgi:hypothetical protein